MGVCLFLYWCMGGNRCFDVWIIIFNLSDSGFNEPGQKICKTLLMIHRIITLSLSLWLILRLLSSPIAAIYQISWSPSYLLPYIQIDQLIKHDENHAFRSPQQQKPIDQLIDYQPEHHELLWLYIDPYGSSHLTTRESHLLFDSKLPNQSHSSMETVTMMST